MEAQVQHQPTRLPPIQLPSSSSSSSSPVSHTQQTLHQEWPDKIMEKHEKTNFSYRKEDKRAKNSGGSWEKIYWGFQQNLASIFLTS